MNPNKAFDMDQFPFKGTLKKIRIVSNNICFGPMPEPNEEVEQRLTINSEGRVWFSGYNFGSGGERYEKARSKNFKIDKDATDKLFGAFAAYFGNEHAEVFATDIGVWVMELTNSEGVIYKFIGSLCADFDYEGTDLSDLVRDTVGMDDLYVFDGNCKPDVITKITVDYHRVTKIGTRQNPIGAEREFITWYYAEHLIVDGTAETLEYIRNITPECTISRKYEMVDAISGMLESFDAEELFSYTKGNPDDVIETPNETKDYAITVEYKKKPSLTITGSFDKDGLPEDFAEFAETVFGFIRFYGVGEIISPSIYGKKKRRKSEYIFCSVIFEQGQKSYYYLTDDDSIRIGDIVIVPAGEDNHEAFVKVVNIEYFSEENAPMPVKKIKQIIRKCAE